MLHLHCGLMVTTPTIQALDFRINTRNHSHSKAMTLETPSCGSWAGIPLKTPWLEVHAAWPAPPVQAPAAAAHTRRQLH